MDKSTRTSERLTAILSTIAAVAVLAAGVVAQQSRSERPDELAYLESDLRFQLNAAFRLNPKEGEARRELLESVLTAWRVSPQTEADRQLLATWLLEATIRSMPGSFEQFPPVPQFGQQQPLVEEPFQITQESKPLEPTLPEHETPELITVAQPSAPMAELTPDLAPQELVTEPMLDVAAPAVEHALASVANPPRQPEPESASPSVQLNLTELTARIAGYHQGLNELESTLETDERPQVDRLAAQIRLLDSLAQDFQFVELYYAALSDEERFAVPEPRSLEPTIDVLHGQLDRLQSEVDGDFLGEYDANLREQVAELRSQLDAIAKRAD